MSDHESRTKSTVAWSWNSHCKWSSAPPWRRTTGDIQTSRRTNNSSAFPRMCRSETNSVSWLSCSAGVMGWSSCRHWYTALSWQDPDETQPNTVAQRKRVWALSKGCWLRPCRQLVWVTKSLKSCKCRLVRKCWAMWRNLLVRQLSEILARPIESCWNSTVWHFPSQPWYNMCVESRRHDLPHQEQSKIDATEPQLQVDNGYMGDGGLLQIVCVLVVADTSSGAIHATWCQTPGRWTCPVLWRQQPHGCVTWCMNAFCLHGDKEGFFQLLLDKWQESVVLKDKTGKFYDKYHRHRATERLWKQSPQCVDSREHIWQFSKTKSRLLKWRHTLQCFLARSDTLHGFSLDTVWEETHEWPRTERFVDNIPKRNLASGWTSSRSPSRSECQSASATMGHRPLAGTWQTQWRALGTTAGVKRSRAVRRTQAPARWVPAALNAMLFTPWSPHLNLPGRPRLQRPAFEDPIEAGTLPRFVEIPTAPTRNPKSETLKSTLGDGEQWTERRRQEVTFRESQSTSSSSSTVADTSLHIPDPQLPKPARPLSLTKGGEHNVGHSRWLIRKHCTLRKFMNFSTWTSLVWWRWSTDRSCNKFSQHAGYQTETGWIFTVHFTNHRCQVTHNQCMWSHHQKHNWTLPRCGFARKLVKDSGFLLRPGAFTARRKSMTWTATSWYQILRRECRNVHNDQKIRSSCVTWMTWWARDQMNIWWGRPVCVWQMWWCCAMKATQSNFLVLRSPRQARASRWKTVQTSWNSFRIFTGWKTRNRQAILADVR